MEAFSPKSQNLQQKQSQLFWAQLPDIEPNKFLFLKDKLPDVTMLPPAAMAVILNMSWASAETAVPLSETSVDNHFTRQYIPEDNSEHHTRRRENLKSHID
jgi:hypothetical protein